MLSKLQFWERDFDGGQLQCISEVTYENDIKKVPSAPDVSNYLISEDEPLAVNRNKDSLRFDGMADNEVETRLKRSCSVTFAYLDLSGSTVDFNKCSFSNEKFRANDKVATHAEKVFKALRAAGVKLAVVSNFDTQLKPVLRALNCDHWFDAVAVSSEVAWHLCDPVSEKVFKALRAAGVKLAVVSNFDTQLKPVLRALNCDHWFDAVAVSTEVEAEKPNPTIFLKACELLEVNPDDVVHPPQLVVENVLAFNESFWIRPAARADTCKSDDDKAWFHFLISSAGLCFVTSFNLQNKLC
ncbi:RNA polymerase II C-terminal domain phosphatase-like 1 [Capsicum baccatum]|uniref:RNA polymerase II C-terminal domain phosphatase-like 1 n=1 Tax=Capsicum baccatum TaxID=33114 RepID=A0A2G2WY89_CAPBA|nr:RNA polymerase II C-terminal domain phosphatase-like 1 [Capsicum baccatum]